MLLVRISRSQMVNVDRITRVEVYETHEIRYVTLHFQDGETYRATEEESDILLPELEKMLLNKEVDITPEGTGVTGL